MTPKDATAADRARRYRERHPDRVRAGKRARREPLARQALARYHERQRYARWVQVVDARTQSRATSMVERALRDGRLMREPCLFCDREDVHAHHHDYALPLVVTFLCPRHHGIAHRVPKGVTT